MDLGNFNIQTILMLAIAIAIAFIAIRFVTNFVYRIVCLVIGGALLIWVLGQLGISLPLITEIINYIADMTTVVWENLQDLLSAVKK